MVRYYLLLAGLAGVATGGLGLTAIHAQAPSNARRARLLYRRV